MPEPDYVVIRSAPGLVLPKYWDGLWLDRSQIGMAIPNLAYETDSMVLAGATGRFEQREDGAVAEVFEVRRNDGDDDAR